jgi:hypothetical protein
MSFAPRSARGTFVDFELLAIKAQLASVPVPQPVEERRIAIEERDGGKYVPPAAINELLALASAAATESESAKVAPKRK